MSNAQRRRKQRDRGAHPGPMTPDRVAQHKATYARLADLERLKRMTRAYLTAVEDAEVEAEQDGQGN